MIKTSRRGLFKGAGTAALAAAFMMNKQKLRAGEQQGASVQAKEFAPGEKATTSGIYDVIHDKLDGDDHAGQHQVTMIAGGVFPSCKACGDWVRFRLHEAAEHAGAVPHFRL